MIPLRCPHAERRAAFRLQDNPLKETDCVGGAMDGAGTAATDDLGRLFAPRSVALVGATDDPSRFGGRVFRYMVRFGFPGRIYPVNPRYSEIQGLKCYPGLRDLPETPDHVGIIVATGRVFDTLGDCAALGVPCATVYSAGFAETGTPEGRARQEKLAAFARSSGMRILGPNCNGLINFVDAFAMTSTGAISGPRRAPGNVGVVSQSGGLGQINIMWRAQEAGLGISYQASCGNEADIDTLDVVRFMLRSETTDVVLLAVEAFRDGAKLRAVAEEAADRGKPIVVLKFGRTEAGSRAAASHTGAVAGVDDIYDAAFRQYGLIRVNECNELYEMAVLLRHRRWPRGRRMASVAATGGNIVQLADVGAGLGIAWPPYAEQTQSVLGELMPGFGSVGNPTDMTSMATGEPEAYRKALQAIADDPNIDAVAPIFAFVSRRDLDLGAAFVNGCAKPAAMIWVGGCTDQPEFSRRDLVEAGMPVYRDATPCLAAMRAAMGYGEMLAARAAGERQCARPAGINADAAQRQLAQAGSTLTEHEAKLLLAEYGLPVTREQLATGADEAVTVACRLGGTVALKIDSADIPHKTEAGAIRLGLTGREAITRAYDEVVAAARRYAPGARINGVLVQEMAQPGVELMLGVIRDPTFGPVVAVGIGGIHVEVLRDMAYRVAPVNHLDAAAMLRELRGYRLLEGVRGQPRCDIDAVCDLLVRLSWLAVDLGDVIAELDINPLVVHETGALVVDALVVRT